VRHDIESAMTFSIGDTVQLKSGGPVMTVAEIEGERVTCVWYASNHGEFRTFVFAQALLEEVEFEED
jgi:uncharacterized protein YodC (DUF2158 family)